MASSNAGSRAKLLTQIECPFDLEAVFTLQYSADGLKGVLKWIIDNLGEMQGSISNMNGDVNK